MMASQGAGLACRITLFTRQNCGLCTSAREVLLSVQRRRPFVLKSLDVMEPRNEKWKIYEFDVPVIHVEFVKQNALDTAESLPSARKLMHRLEEEQVERLMDDAEKSK